MKLTFSQEEYLKTIYIIKNTEKQVRVTDIAKKLGYSKPSVNRALNNLADEKLIKYQIYKDIELTKKGVIVAKDIIKRHDILKLFLTEILETDENTAEIEAASMKHAISENTIIKLEKYINKILDLGDLDCGYDKDSQQCRTCVKISAKRRLRGEENGKSLF
ncbi:MAG: metal-dependent transcriptional regulator [Oscillospiraceae bacterium]|nr:metal-dependent transcriptional regulator [Oscillospiraceae bacterium]